MDWANGGQRRFSEVGVIGLVLVRDRFFLRRAPFPHPRHPLLARLVFVVDDNCQQPSLKKNNRQHRYPVTSDKQTSSYPHELDDSFEIGASFGLGRVPPPYPCHGQSIQLFQNYREWIRAQWASPFKLEPTPT